jgi:hypothetical protein
MSDFKHPWDKKHKPSFDPNAPKTYDEAKVQFEKALAKASKNPANQVLKPTNPGYMMKDGIPHKFSKGKWIPLTRIN